MSLLNSVEFRIRVSVTAPTQLRFDTQPTTGLAVTALCNVPSTHHCIKHKSHPLPVKPVRTPVAILGSLGVCIYVPESRHWLMSYSPIYLTYPDVIV